MEKKYKPLVLIILDGWGYRESAKYNAIKSAQTPNWDYFWKNYPHMLIEGSGKVVGLPEGQMGNSEVGHLNLGAGRIIYQDITRISKEIEEKIFCDNKILHQAVNKVKDQQSSLHILGLLSPGGVHSHEIHIHAMLEMAIHNGVDHIYFHAFLDGRDCAPKSALASLEKVEAIFAKYGKGKIASMIGRYYAMDRDKRWDRIEKAYDLLTLGSCDYHAKDAIDALNNAYQRGETDEFVKATAIGPTPVTINNNDAVIFMNFRADRARELTRAFVDSDFSGFIRKKQPKLLSFVCLTQYAADIKTDIAFKPQKLKNVLGEYLANLGLKQLRIAETEKYAHVTFFFNGGIEKPFANEQRILIPSPKVATYDLKPEMSAFELTDQLAKAIVSSKYDVIICNYANADMVGHSGDFAATQKAVAAIDSSLGKVYQALQQCGGEALITADHGNAECMYDETTRQVHTAHTHEAVPLIYLGHRGQFIAKNGALSDIAPTLLHLLGLEKPKEMTGISLLGLTS